MALNFDNWDSLNQYGWNPQYNPLSPASDQLAFFANQLSDTNGLNPLDNFLSLNNNFASVPATPTGNSIWSKLADPNGMGGMLLGAGKALTGLITGMQQYGIAKDTLKENKRQFQLNYDAQKSLTNAEMEDRARRRYQERPDLAQDPSSYMDRWGIK